MRTENIPENYHPLVLVAEDDDSNCKLIKPITLTALRQCLSKYLPGLVW